MMSTTDGSARSAQASVTTCLHLLSSLNGFVICSRPERPTPKSACFRSMVATTIHLITRWRSLRRLSHTYNPIGSPCSLLSPKGELQAYHVLHEYQSRLGSAFSPVAHHLRQRRFESLNLATYLLVQACQHLWLVVHHDVYQQFTFINHATQF